MKNDDKKELLTVREVSEYLRVSESTVWNYIRAGKLKATRLTSGRTTGRTLIKRSEISKILSS